MITDMLDMLYSMVMGFLALITGLFVSVLLISSLYSLFWAPYTCDSFGKNMEMNTKYSFWGGCFVTMPDGKILPKNIAEDILKQKYQFEVK